MIPTVPTSALQLLVKRMEGQILTMRNGSGSQMVVLSQGVFTVPKLSQFFTMPTDYHHNFICMHELYNFSLFVVTNAQNSVGK